MASASAAVATRAPPRAARVNPRLPARSAPFPALLPGPDLVPNRERRAEAVEPLAVGRDHVEDPEAPNLLAGHPPGDGIARLLVHLLVAKLPVAQGDDVLEERVPAEPLHPVEHDLGLPARRGADRDLGAVDGQEVVQADQGRGMGLEVAARDDRGDLSSRTEVGTRDPALIGGQRLPDRLGEGEQAAIARFEAVLGHLASFRRIWRDMRGFQGMWRGSAGVRPHSRTR